MNISRVRKIVDSLLWGVICLIMAFVFSMKLPPYVGVIVFVGFFVVGVAFFRKAFSVYREGKG